MWDLSLVDPDNRRPVDYEVRRQALEAMQEQGDQPGRAGGVPRGAGPAGDGRVKLWTIHRRWNCGTGWRIRSGAGLCAGGGYKRRGRARDRVFARGKVAGVVPRFAYTLMDGKTRLPLNGAWGRGELIVPEMRGGAGERVHR